MCLVVQEEERAKVGELVDLGFTTEQVCACVMFCMYSDPSGPQQIRGRQRLFTRPPPRNSLRIQSPVPCSRGVIIFVSPRFLGRGSSGEKRGQYVSICGVAVDTAQVNMRHHNSSFGPSKRHLPPPITLTPSRASTEVPPVVSTLEKHPSHDMLNTKLGPDGKGDAGDVALPPISSMLC